MHLSGAALRSACPLLLLQKVTTAVTAAAWGLLCLTLWVRNIYQEYSTFGPVQDLFGVFYLS